MGFNGSSLEICCHLVCVSTAVVHLSHLLLGIGPARNLNNHVEDGLLLIGKERNVVEWRDGFAIFLEVDAVLEGMRGGDSAHRVRGG